MAFSRLATLLAGSALIMALGGVALADGGGGGGSMGGGMGAMPSETTPAFDPAVEYQKGADALAKSDFKAANKAFTNVSRAAPKDANVWYLLGMSKAGLNDLKGAQRAYENAVKNDVNLVVARRELAITLTKLKQREKAEGQLGMLKQRAATCANTCPEAKVINQAVTDVEAAISGTPSARLDAPAAPTAQAGDASYLRAVGLINEHRYAEALTALDAARLAFGPHPDVLTYQGYVNRQLGDYATAESYYQQALSLAPEHRGAMEYYGELKVVRGDIAGARDLLARLEKVCAFGCSQAEDLRQWIDAGGQPSL